MTDTDASRAAASVERRLLAGALVIAMAAYTLLGWSQSAAMPVRSTR